MTKMLVSDYVLDFLVKKNVKKVFLLTGGAISFQVDAFSRNKKIDYVSVAHEQAAAMMADSYSRIGPFFMHDGYLWTRSHKPSNRNCLLIF